MINKRLVGYLKEDKKYVYFQVLMQWLSLICQVVIIGIMANMINQLFNDQVVSDFVLKVVIIIVLIVEIGRAHV